MNKYNVVYSTLTFNIKRLKEKLYRNQQKVRQTRAGTSHDPNDVIFIAFFSETVGGAYVFPHTLTEKGDSQSTALKENKRSSHGHSRAPTEKQSKRGENEYSYV